MAAIQQMLMAAQASFRFEVTIASNSNNYNLKTAAISAGWDQTLPLDANITVNSGVYISSTSTAVAAFDTGSTFPDGSTLTLINNGLILGRGGNGGAGTGWPLRAYSVVEAGGAGGVALAASAPLTVINNGTVGGGGGGGGGGGAYENAEGTTAGGGGGGGRPLGAGGPIGSPAEHTITASPGTAASLTSPGVGQATAPWGHRGGDGGNLGQAGATGAYGTSYYDGAGTPGGAGGSPGAAVVGNSQITWVATGTRLGVIT